MTEIAEEILFSSQTQPENEQISILKRHFPNCFDKQGAFLPEKMAETLQSNGIKTEKESYSLNWLGKSYAKILKDRQPETLLAEDIEHNQKPENQNSENILIQGDNLEVLKHLKHAYKNQIKMIYIDPPYNTGSDGFVYQDDRKFTPQQLVELGMDLEESERVLEFTAKKSNSHSAWLTFMYPRLKVAHDLLKDDGVIFISIDDNEQAQLKLLCDEVFGEENFVAEFVWKSRQNKDNRNITGASIDHEYIFCYSKTSLYKALRGAERDTSQYSNPDNDPRGNWASGNMVGLLPEDQRPNCHYDLINPKTGINYGKPKLGWRYDKNTMQRLIDEDRILWAELPTGRPRRKVFLNELIEQYTGFSSILGKDIYTRNGTTELEDLFGSKYFDFPKSIQLIKQLIEQAILNPNDLILDFFAGSGTTAHAVMQLNAEDKGNRKFICVQLPEPTNEKSEAYKAGYKTIFDITKARIEKSAVKIRQDFQEITADLGFKIFKTEPHFQTALNTDFDPQIDFLPKNNLTDEQLHQLLTTWRVFDGCRLTEKVETVDLAGYTAYYCRQHLYLLASGFTSESVKALIEHLDNDRDFVPERIVLFGENIDSAMQKELAQAVKTYANKKGLNNLSVLARY
ncbi:putative methyltransferase [Haemophilus influenzae]|uniref:site-specific DNA-methyltransferase n=1 Tax=Haemophilus influenzae TaxID=727 RepID=UPI000D016CB1|nr:site-specific DNA-methyltransferase [Haemophilus influenzae]PRJ95459.1 putative methyltransferase [Haemophilus influenzae]PRK61499.1 putative methyltransferase [Haemophilus influenzae]PRM07060.1 putative methyltransferase [Haemophilus influenzae]